MRWQQVQHLVFARVYGIRGSKEYSHLRWSSLQLDFDSKVSFVDDDGEEMCKPVHKVCLLARKDKKNLYQKLGDVAKHTRRAVDFFWEVRTSSRACAFALSLYVPAYVRPCAPPSFLCTVSSLLSPVVSLAAGL